MKQLITFLLCLFTFFAEAQVNTNDTNKYFKSYDYGFSYKRLQAREAFIMPTDTVINKLGAVSLNGAIYLGNGIKWTSIGGGGGTSTDTTSLSNRINQRIDSLRRSNDSVFARKNGVFVFQYKDSVGGGLGSDTSKVVIAQVHNATGTTLLRGEVVYLFGSTGNVASVKRANNKQDSTSSKTFGIVRDNILAGANGFITTQGQVDKLTLGAYNEGDVLWLDSLDGQFTKVKPQGPFHAVFIGIVERANNGNGLAYIKPQNGVELDEVHDVQINNTLNNQIIVYSDTQKVWKNRSIYSLVDTTSTIATKTNLNNYVNLTTAQTIAGQKTFSSNIKMPTTGSNLILQILSDGTIASMASATYPTPVELAYVKGVTSAIQTQINSKVNISDTANMLSSYSTRINDKLNSTDTASLSNRINNKQTDLDLLQLMSYGIKAESYGITLANMTGQQALVTNRLFLYPFNWNVSDTLKNISFYNRAAFTNTATNYNGVAIYSLSGGTLTRIMFTPNDGTFWNTTINSWSSKSVPATYLTKGIYFIGYQFSGSGTPTLGSGAPLVIASTQSPSDPPSGVNTNGVKFSTFITNLTSTPPSSIAMSATTAAVNVPYFMLF